MSNCISKAAKMNSRLCKKDADEAKHTLLWILAIVGAIVTVAAIAYAVYSIIVSRKEEEFDEFEELEDFGYGFEEDFMAEDAE